MKVTNGNGKKTPPDSISHLKLDEKGHVIVDDLVPASVLLMFFAQKLGKASFTQIAAKVEAAAVVMDRHLMQNALDALQARQFLSYAKGKVAGSGEVVDMWKPRKANFGGMPDVAQVDQAFLSALVSTPDAEELISQLNSAEEEGDGKAKAKEKLKYADFYSCEFTFRVKDMLLGGRPSSPYTDHRLDKGPKYPLEAKLRFPRNSEGWPVVPISNIRGWLAAGLRQINISEACIGYIGITGGKIVFDGKIEQYAQPVVDLSGANRGAGGLGITTYEAIANPTFTFRFTIPKRGLLTFTQFDIFMIKYAANSVRGLSNARSNEWGFVEIIDSKYLGEGRMAKESVEPLLDDLSPAARDHAEKVLAKLGERDVDLFVGRHVEIE